MKPLKAIWKYRLLSLRYTALIMYLSMYLLFAAVFISAEINSSHNIHININCLEMISGITLFIVGLCSFKEEFLFFSACGVSRRTQLAGAAAVFGCCAAFFALIDTFSDLLFSSLTPGGLDYSSVFSMLYSGNDFSVGAMPGGFLWRFCLYLFILLLGHMISSAYFRMGKLTKTIVSVGVPLLLLYVLPFLDAFVLGNKLYPALLRFFNMILGYPQKDNLYGVACLSLLAIAAILTGFIYLLIRRAPVRK